MIDTTRISYEVAIYKRLGKDDEALFDSVPRDNYKEAVAYAKKISKDGVYGDLKVTHTEIQKYYEYLDQYGCVTDSQWLWYEVYEGGKKVSRVSMR